MSLIIPANTLASGGYAVDNSARFNKASSDYLVKTFGSNGSLTTWTLSYWIKRSELSVTQGVFSSESNGDNSDLMYFQSSDKFDWWEYTSAYKARKATNMLFRDTSAFYNIVCVWNTSNATSTDRQRIYVNGERITSFATNVEPALNEASRFNSTVPFNIGRSSSGSSGYFGGYMSEVCFIDGQALDATSFGEFNEDSGIWKPIDVSGLTFGTNGFYLDFENSGALGADVSGNTNNFTVNNLTAIDQSTDTCTNNFATWNPLDNFYQSNTYSEGNLQVQTQSTSFTYNSATIGVSTGKWYWEVEYDAKSGGTDQPMIGITSTQPTANDNELGNFPNDFAWYTDNGTGYLSNNNTYSNVGFNAYTVGDVISVALDLDNNKLYFAKNGTYEKSGDPTSGSTGTGAISITAPASTPLGVYFPSVGDATNSQNATFKTNFGSPPYSESGGETDGNGYGNFAHAVPSGYYALNTKNLAEYG